MLVVHHAVRLHGETHSFLSVTNYGPSNTTPLPHQGIFLFHLVNYKPLTYNTVYVYPWWGEVIGWCLALSSMLCIPISLLYKLFRAKGTFREVSQDREEPRQHNNCSATEDSGLLNVHEIKMFICCSKTCNPSFSVPAGGDSVQVRLEGQQEEEYLSKLRKN